MMATLNLTPLRVLYDPLGGERRALSIVRYYPRCSVAYGKLIAHLPDLRCLFFDGCSKGSIVAWKSFCCWTTVASNFSTLRSSASIFFARSSTLQCSLRTP
jgi:hypothetical protein